MLLARHGVRRCWAPVTVAAQGSCSAGHPHELRLCRAHADALTAGQGLSGPCAKCLRPVTLTATEVARG